MSPKTKKLVSVSATSTPVTGTRKETVETIKGFETTKAVKTTKAVGTAGIGKNSKESEGEYPENLARVPCIRYPITFQKKSVPISALFDSSSEVNAIHPTVVRELGLPIRPTDVSAQKIDGTMLNSFGIVVVAFSVTDKANRVSFFEKTFLLANVSPEVVLRISFLTLSGADIDFLGRELRWRTYTTEKALPTIRRVELVGKKEFAAVALDPESGTFVVHVASLSSDVSLNSSPLELNVHPFRRSQISNLIAEEASTKVPAKYLDFADVFSPDLASELPEHTGINDHAIKLVDSQ